jgi:outer membrane lipoprotein carrier protein
MTLKTYCQDSEYIKSNIPDIIIKSISENSRSINTLKGSFTQNKLINSLGIEVESKGIFYYKKYGEKLRWEYKTPTQFIVIFASGNMRIENTTVQTISPKNMDKLFSQLNRIILTSLNGEINDLSDFNKNIMENSTNNLVKLTPINSELSDILKEFNIYFEKISKRIIKVEIIEVSNDITEINFNDIQINTEISDNLF